jgi:hypothetical protein
LILLPEEAAMGVPYNLFEMTVDQVILSERYEKVTKERIHDKDVVSAYARLPARYATTLDMMIEPLQNKKEYWNGKHVGMSCSKVSRMNVQAGVLTLGTDILQHMIGNDLKELKQLKRMIFRTNTPLHCFLWGRDTHMFNTDYEVDPATGEETRSEDGHRVIVAKKPVNIYADCNTVVAPLGDIADFLAVPKSEVIAGALCASILTWEDIPDSAIPMFKPDMAVIRERIEFMIERCNRYVTQ